MKRNLPLKLTVFAMLLGLSSLIAQPEISFQPLATGLTSPVDVVNANDGSGRLFVVERPGRIRIWNGNTLLPTPFLDIANLVRSNFTEQGLLSIAFHPNYNANGYFFVWYNNLEGHVTLARYTRTSFNVADPASGVILLTIFKPFPNHNGAKLNFGRDGYLYFGTGDGGSGGDPLNRAQNGDSLHGKMIRLDINNPNPPYYSIPLTNPHLNNPAIRDEIIALGLRNPWRWSFDRLTGDMWLADVGQNVLEEVNYLPAANIIGRNFGWRCLEGTRIFDSTCGFVANAVTPIFEYPHNNATGGFSVTGGYIYRGAEYPALRGYYICSDYVSNHGWLIRATGTGSFTATMQSTWAAGISSYGEGEDGALYATSLSAGTLYKVIATNVLPVHLIAFSGRLINSAHELNWQVADEDEGTQYILEKRTGASGAFTEVYKTIATSARVANNYSNRIDRAQAAFYRLRMITPAGQTIYSQIVYLKGQNDKDQIKATINANQLLVTLPADSRSISLYEASGKLLLRQSTTGRSGYISLPLSHAQRGLLVIRVEMPDRIEQIKTVY